MIRIALIGCDRAADDYAQLASRLQGASLVAAVDPDLARARRTAHTLDAPTSAASFEELLGGHTDAFDAVVLSCAADSPQPVLQQAAEAGKHVLLDMRLMLLMSPGDAAIKADRAAGITLMVSQVTRFLPSVVEVKSCLASGILGTPGLLRIHDWKTPDAGVPEGTGAAAAIFQAVLRDVDLANWIFGGLPTEVYAAGHAEQTALRKTDWQSVPQPGKTDWQSVPRPGPCGYIQVHLGYPDGGMALMDHSMMLPAVLPGNVLPGNVLPGNVLPGNGADYFSLSLVGSAGAAYADDHRNVHLLYRGGKPEALPAGQGKLHHLAQFQEFVDAIRTGRPPAITWDDAQKAAQVVRAMDRSLESSRAMRLVGSCYEFV